MTPVESNTKTTSKCSKSTCMTSIAGATKNSKNKVLYQCNSREDRRDIDTVNQYNTGETIEKEEPLHEKSDKKPNIVTQ